LSAAPLVRRIIGVFNMNERFGKAIWTLAIVGLLGGLAALMTACNTVEGAGEDIEEGGEAISDTSRDVRD